jgi:arylsulfatase
MKNTLVIILSDNGAAPDGGLYPTKSGFFISFSPSGKWRLNGEGIREGSGPDNLPGPPNTFAAYGLAWALTSNTPLRSTKTTGYEGGIRTPCIIYWPELIGTKGKIVDDVSHVIDIMPTFLELTGATVRDSKRMMMTGIAYM